MKWYNNLMLIICFIFGSIFSQWISDNYIGEWKASLVIVTFASPFLAYILLDMYKEIKVR